MILSLSGTDGSGKTTLGKSLQYDFQKLGFKTEYRIEFDYFLLGYLLKLLPSKFLNSQRKSFLEPEKKATPSKKSSSLLFRAWAYLVIFDQFLEWIYLKIKNFFRPGIILTDRCAFDFFLSFEYLNCLDPLSRFLFRKFPSFNLPLLLEVDPKVAYDRKKETHSYPLEYYQDQRKRYIQEAKRKGIHIVNTNRPLEEVKQEILLLLRNNLQPSDSQFLHHLALGRLEKKSNLPLRAKRQIAPNDLVPQAAQFYGRESVYARAQNQFWAQFMRSLRLTDALLGKANIPFLIFKTLPRQYAVCPTDLDILVPENDFEKTNTILAQQTTEKEVPSVHKAITYKNEGLIPIDTHYEISWLAHRVLDLDKMWKRVSKMNVEDLQVQVPSVEDEILVVAGHSLYQHHYTTLGEFLFLYDLMSSAKKLDLDYMNGQAKAYFWEDKLWNLLKAVNQKAYLLGLPPIELGSYGKNASSNLSLKSLMAPVFNHSWAMIPKANLEQKKDFIITFYRRARYYFTLRLPYNEDWLSRFSA